MERIPLPPAPPLSSETLAQLRRYADLLCSMNDRVRLVGPRDAETLWSDHIEDCLRLLPLLPQAGSVIDVGTGGGLPGAVLAICRPDLQFTLLDSLSRKTKALSEIVAELGLQNAQVVCCRSEDYAAAHREAFQCAVVRAVSEAGIIAEFLTPLVAQGGLIAAMKGSSVGEELAPMSGKWSKIGLSNPRLYEYGFKDHTNFMLCWDKIKACPDAYPRSPGRAEKKPWWK